MVKASLRRPSNPTQPQVVAEPPAGTVPGHVTQTDPVEVEGVVVETKTTVAAPVQGGLEDAIPSTETASSVAAPADEAPRTTTGSALTRRPAMTVARSAGFDAEGMEGDWGQEDLKFPTLKLVQGNGPLSAQFDVGTIIYNDIELLPPPSKKAGVVNPALRFVPVVLTKQFREKLTEEQIKEGEVPRIANSVTEVEEMGGTTRWFGDQRPANYWEPSARCIFLIEQPKDSEHPSFGLELDGKFYAVGVYYAAGGAFRDSAKIIYNTALTSLLVPVLDEAGQVKRSPKGQVVKKPMLWKCFWNLHFTQKTNDNFTFYRPVVKLNAKEETGPEIRAYCENLVAGSGEAQQAGE